MFESQVALSEIFDNFNLRQIQACLIENQKDFPNVAPIEWYGELIMLDKLVPAVYTLHFEILISPIR